MRRKPTLNQINKKPALWYCESENLFWISYPDRLTSDSMTDEASEWRESDYIKPDFLKMKDTDFICWI